MAGSGVVPETMAGMRTDVCVTRNEFKTLGKLTDALRPKDVILKVAKTGSIR